MTQRVRSVVPSDSVTWPGPTSVTPVPRRTWTPSLWSTLLAYSWADSENGPSTACPWSIMITLAEVTARSRYSAASVPWIISASAPAISVPVAPAPTMTNVSAP